MKFKRIAAALTVILIVAAAYTAIWSYDQQIESDSKALKLRVTDFYVDDPTVIVWGAVGWSFNVTIENYGITNASNVQLYVTMVNNETNTNLWNYNTTIDNVQAGSQKMVHGDVLTDMGSWNSYLLNHVPNPKNVVAFNASLVVGSKLVAQKII